MENKKMINQDFKRNHQSNGKVNRRRFLSLTASVLASGGLYLLTNPVRAALSANGFQTDFATDNIDNKEEKGSMVHKTYNLPGARFFPESIGYWPATNYFFVGSLENGQVVRGDRKTGEVVSFLAAGVNGMTSVAGVKLDHFGHLLIAGGYSGKIFIYDANKAKLLANFQVDNTQTVVNDFVALPDGQVFVTNSLNPYLYKVSVEQEGNFSFDQKWLSLAGSPIEYQSGLNLNGITVSADNRYLIVGQTNTGKLFRVDIATKKIDEIELGGENVLHADGILLEGHRLYVARNALNIIATVQLSKDYLHGRVISNTTDPAFQFPTALAKAGEQFLIVNAQLDKEGPGLTPVLPFTVVAIPIPEDSEQED